MRKTARKTLGELIISMPIISELDQRSFMGGGNGTPSDPYTVAEFDSMCNNGTWNGGYVVDWGYTFPEVEVYGSYGSGDYGNYSNYGDEGYGNYNYGSYGYGGSYGNYGYYDYGYYTNDNYYDDGPSEIPTIPYVSEYGTYAGAILSYVSDVPIAGRYVKIVNISLTLAQGYNSANNYFNGDGLTWEDAYNFSVTAIGALNWQGASVALVIEFYKTGLDYMVKLKVELDNYIQDMLSPGTSPYYP